MYVSPFRDAFFVVVAIGSIASIVSIGLACLLPMLLLYNVGIRAIAAIGVIGFICQLEKLLLYIKALQVLEALALRVDIAVLVGINLSHCNH